MAWGCRDSRVVTQVIVTRISSTRTSGAVVVKELTAGAVGYWCSEILVQRDIGAVSQYECCSSQWVWWWCWGGNLTGSHLPQVRTVVCVLGCWWKKVCCWFWWWWHG